MSEKLKKALSNLDRVSKIPLEELKVKDGQLIFSPRLFSLFRPIDPSVIEALKFSLKTVKTQIIKLKAMEAGTQDQQKLAKEALAIIERFNAVVKKRQLPGLKSMLSYIFSMTQEFSLHPISFPRIHKAPSLPAEKIEKTFWNHLQLTDVRVRDLFFMKALTLAQKFIPSRQYALKIIKETPLQSSFDPKKSLFWVTQDIHPWPGFSLTIKGAFQRDLQTALFSLPLTKSFQATQNHFQSGFPHPKEYTGASLAFPLLPIYPHHLEDMPLLKSLLQKKESLTHELLPGGKLVPNLIALLENKRKAAFENMHKWIELHLQLASEIIKSSPNYSLEAMEACESFFHDLHRQKDPFEKLTSTYNEMGQHALVTPFHKLQEAWIGDSLPKDGGECRKEIYRLLLPKILCETNDLQSKFIHHLSYALLPAFQQILAKYLSESHPINAYPLDLFAKKVQGWAFRQQYTFYNELTQSLDAWKMMQQSLKEDCILFSCKDIQDPTVIELENYFAANTGPGLAL